MTSRYVCLSCSKRFKKYVYCIDSVCRRCTSMCSVEAIDEHGNATLRKAQSPPILATARSLQATRRLR